MDVINIIKITIIRCTYDHHWWNMRPIQVNTSCCICIFAYYSAVINVFSEPLSSYSSFCCPIQFRRLRLKNIFWISHLSLSLSLSWESLRSLSYCQVSNQLKRGFWTDDILLINWGSYWDLNKWGIFSFTPTCKTSVGLGILQSCKL